MRKKLFLETSLDISPTGCMQPEAMINLLVKRGFMDRHIMLDPLNIKPFSKIARTPLMMLLHSSRSSMLYTKLIILVAKITPWMTLRVTCMPSSKLSQPQGPELQGKRTRMTSRMKAQVNHHMKQKVYLPPLACCHHTHKPIHNMKYLGFFN